MGSCGGRDIKITKRDRILRGHIGTGGIGIHKSPRKRGTRRCNTDCEYLGKKYFDLPRRRQSIIVRNRKSIGSRLIDRIVR